MQKLSRLLMALLLLSACSTDRSASNTAETDPAASDTTAKPSASATTDFDAAFARFFEALHNSDTAAINQFIHPTYGLWIIEQPGAVPKMTQVYDISKFGREYQSKSFFTIAPEVQHCKLTKEAFPAFDCAEMNYDAGKTGFSKDGCFVWEPDKFKSSGYWNYANLSESQLQRIKETLPHIQRSVLHTKTAFEFHFGYVDAQWHLLFTKIIYPCSA
ncbi:hypothetical protein [uncultured Pontibacter sp.]|uniref:hypothetical protein n=1 Tax=uncultured Pontibacter sp. TaxID=453356 RepID=UPI00261364EB|nr:hypothetical protein [uncultured Pontibacter sp.]